MLSTWLTRQTINIIDAVDDWKQAIGLSAAPLLKEGTISSDYIQAIYHLHEKIGAYYVLAPGIAMPHARPEEGVSKLGLSLLVIKKGVNFDSADNDPVYVVFLLAAPDNLSHLQMLTELAELLSTQEDIEKIIKAQNIEQILSVVNQY